MEHKTGLRSTLVVLLLLVTLDTSAACYMNQVTRTESKADIERLDVLTQVSAPSATSDNNICSVFFKAQISGQWVAGYGEYEFGSNLTEDQACEYALTDGVTQLLVRDAETSISANQTMVCSDDPNGKPLQVSIGDLVAESQLQPDPSRPGVFQYSGTTCKRFIETALISAGNLYQYHGVICKLSNATWTVVDKW